MTNLNQKELKNTQDSDGRYTPGYDPEYVKHFQGRTVDKDAAFFIPFLNSNMNFLDCGCGPGTISVGFAKLLTSGQVTGIDMENSQIKLAKIHAESLDVNNIRFEVANINRLPFPDESFDAVFAHAVLEHLKDPLQAIKEMYRVLKPGGIIGVRDDDIGGLIIAPPNSQVKKLVNLMEKVMEYHGGNHRVGRSHRQLLRQAGFNKTVASASCEYDGDLNATRWRAGLVAKAAESFVADTAVPLGWASKDELADIARACKEWGENPDAFDTTVWCEAIGWKK